VIARGSELHAVGTLTGAADGAGLGVVIVFFAFGRRTRWVASSRTAEFVEQINRDAFGTKRREPRAILWLR